MTPNLRTALLMVAAVMVTGALILQQKELSRFRMVIAELVSLRSEQPVASTVTNTTDIEERSQEASEVQRLRAEVAQLRREKVEMSAFQASIDKLAMELSASPANFNRRSGSMVIYGSGLGFSRQPSNTSPLVAKATSLAQSSPEEAARWVAALPNGDD